MTTEYFGLPKKYTRILNWWDKHVNNSPYIASPFAVIWQIPLTIIVTIISCLYGLLAREKLPT